MRNPPGVWRHGECFCFCANRLSFRPQLAMPAPPPCPCPDGHRSGEPPLPRVLPRLCLLPPASEPLNLPAETPKPRHPPARQTLADRVALEKT
ncbi:hypothetical protein AAFF_G00178200 [Aldrovandia affinis]|uniref:Uncharacterized protein n=1 Tax=Aldrovandia affinis TaxID=143900 RepID=A0AAD7RKP7_9TELE|nr:hypothetical protein AAFF_G00178200 [Aldrovandia affinis]